MNRRAIRDKTKQIIANVAGIDVEELDRDLKLREELMLDSLKEMEIVARTELSFGITLEENQLINVQTLDDYCDLIEKAVESR
jgi:acyl carrier protein